MVDAVKILGSLLGGGGLAKGSGANVLESVLGAATGGSQGDIGDLLGSLLEGGQSPQAAGGMGDILGEVLGGKGGGILGDILGGATGDQGGNAPGLDDLLGGILGGGAPSGRGGTPAPSTDLGSLVTSALKQFGNSEKAAREHVEPPAFEEHSPGLDYQVANDQATVMIRAMIYAARADGHVDREEQAKITGKLGTVSREEADFVNAELARPLDIDEFVRDVPIGMENQVYAMSLMAIDLDSNPEAKYLHELARELRIASDDCNRIHQQLGAPLIYS